MARKYLARSAAALSEADRFEAQLNWMLFVQEQDARIWGSSEGSWRPGDPLFEKPRYRRVMYSPFVSGYEPTNGNYVRQMFEFAGEDPETWEDDIDEWLDVLRCKDCEVSWTGNEPCWVCGEDRPITRFEPLGFFNTDNGVGFAEMVPTGRDASAAMQYYGMSAGEFAEVWVRYNRRIDRQIIQGPSNVHEPEVAVLYDEASLIVPWNAEPYAYTYGQPDPPLLALPDDLDLSGRRPIDPPQVRVSIYGDPPLPEDDSPAWARFDQPPHRGRN